MPLQTFSDRFRYNNPAFAALESDPNFDQLSDDALFAASPELKEMVQMVRRHSVIIKRVRAVEIFYCITNHSDPEIALILAAGKDSTGAFMFADTTVLKQFMFGEGVPSSGLYIHPQRNIFVEGIRRISAALAAAELIGRYSTLDEQAKHAEILRKRAIEELDRILYLPKEVTTPTPSVEDQVLQGFFFERKEFTIPANYQLQMSVYMPSVSRLISDWSTPRIYNSGVHSTAKIVSDLADLVNETVLPTLYSTPSNYAQPVSYSNILASPVLNGPLNLHQVKFTARARLLNVAAEVLTVKFEIVNTVTSTPTTDPKDLYFTWGPSTDGLGPYKLNSVLMIVNNAKVEAVSSSSIPVEDRLKFQPTVLYLRRNPDNAINTSAYLKFRATPIHDQVVTLTIPYIIGTNQAQLDRDRPNQCAIALSNALFDIHGDTRCLSALFRNDPDTTPQQTIAGLELIAWSVTNPETWLVLDILEVPPDIEIATGDLTGPVTEFSNRPKSIRVQSTYSRYLNASTTPSSGNTDTARPKIITRRKSTLYQQVMDDMENIFGHRRIVR